MNSIRLIALLALAVVAPRLHAGSYSQNFTSLPLGATNLNDGTSITSTVPAVVNVVNAQNKQLQLTVHGVQSTLTALVLPQLDTNRTIHAFTAKWRAMIWAPFDDGADGYSFNFGPLLGRDLLDRAIESGFGVGLSFGVQTYAGNSSGFYIRVNDSVKAFRSFTPRIQWGVYDNTLHLFEVDWNEVSGMTVRVDGDVIFASVPTPEFSAQTGDVFAFGARTGGLTESVTLDDIAVTTSDEWDLNDLAGAYTGLVRGAGQQFGLLSITVEADADFRGTIKTLEGTRTFSGTFSNESLFADLLLPATATLPETRIVLELNRLEEAVFGTVVLGAEPGRFVSAYRNAPSLARDRALVGAHTAVSDTAADGGATAFIGPVDTARIVLTVKVSNAGKAMVKGFAPDGSPFGYSGTITKGSVLPFFASLYGGRGFVAGELDFNPGQSFESGLAAWVKTGDAGGPIHPAGVTNAGSILGAKFVPPAKGTSLFNTPNLIVSAVVPGVWGLTQTATAGANDKITGTNKVSLTVSRSNGAVSGSFDTTNGLKRVKGVFIQPSRYVLATFPEAPRSGQLGVFENAPE